MLEVQKIGEGPLAPPSPFEQGFQTSDHMHTPQIDEALENVRINCAREDVPDLEVAEPHDGTLMICGGGPSLKDTIEQVEQRYLKGYRIIAINDTYDFLRERGIIPDYFAMAEIAPWPKAFLERAHVGTAYYLADIAHHSCYERLKGYNVIRWHLGVMEDDAFYEPYRDVIKSHFKRWHTIGGGEAVSTKAIALGSAWGFRDFEMYGVDGCYREGHSSHAYLHRFTSWPELITCAGRQFLAPYYLARQADDIRRMCELWGDQFKLRCYGDGLVQHMHRAYWPSMYRGEDADGCSGDSGTQQAVS